MAPRVSAVNDTDEIMDPDRPDDERDMLDAVHDRVAAEGSDEQLEVWLAEIADGLCEPMLTRRSRTLDGAFVQMRHCAEMAMLPELSIEYDGTRVVFRVDWYEAPEGRPTDQGPIYLGPPLMVDPASGEMIER